VRIPLITNKRGSLQQTLCLELQLGLWPRMRWM